MILEIDNLEVDWVRAVFHNRSQWLCITLTHFTCEITLVYYHLGICAGMC